MNLDALEVKYVKTVVKPVDVDGSSGAGIAPGAEAFERVTLAEFLGISGQHVVDVLGVSLWMQAHATELSETGSMKAFSSSETLEIHETGVIQGAAFVVNFGQDAFPPRLLANESITITGINPATNTGTHKFTASLKLRISRIVPTESPARWQPTNPFQGFTRPLEP